MVSVATVGTTSVFTPLLFALLDGVRRDLGFVGAALLADTTFDFVALLRVRLEGLFAAGFLAAGFFGAAF